MQLGAGEHNRGRVMGIWLVVLAGSQPAGNLVAGHLADAYGVPFALAVLAAGIAATGGLVGDRGARAGAAKTSPPAPLSRRAGSVSDGWMKKPVAHQ